MQLNTLSPHARPTFGQQSGTDEQKALLATALGTAISPDTDGDQLDIRPDPWTEELKTELVEQTTGTPPLNVSRIGTDRNHAEEALGQSRFGYRLRSIIRWARELVGNHS